MADVSVAGLMMLMAIKKQNRHSKNSGILGTAWRWAMAGNMENGEP
jgi:hypothetical protein